MASQSNAGQTSSVVDAFKDMSCEELAAALSKRIPESDLQTLKAENIDGGLFLELLDEPDLKDTFDKLTGGGKVKTRRVLREIKDESFEFDGWKPVEPDMPWCSTETPTEAANGCGNGTTATDNRMQRGWIPSDAVWPWKDYPEIYVKFLHVDQLANWKIGDGQAMNTDTVLRYANTWNDLGGEDIPRFVEAKHGETAQIRVSFNNNQLRNSSLGMRAQNIPVAEPTMNLDLHNGCPSHDFKIHLIIHEFGHALGLGHEHQRSNFWSCIKGVTNIEKMKADLRVTDEQFDIDWAEIDNSEEGHHTPGYDPDSIMHYWFKVEWLTNGYSDKKKVERDRDNGSLSDEDARVLLGIHKRHCVLAKQPSQLDIQLLQQVYGARELAPPEPKRIRLEAVQSAAGTGYQDQPSSNRLNPKSLLDQLKNYAYHWRSIGMYLGFRPGELNNIQTNTAASLCGPEGYLEMLLTRWLLWSPGDGRGSTGFATLEGLKDALRQANLGVAAHDLHL